MTGEGKGKRLQLLKKNSLNKFLQYIPTLFGLCYDSLSFDFRKYLKKYFTNFGMFFLVLKLHKVLTIKESEAPAN